MMALEKLVDCPFSLMPGCRMAVQAMCLTMDAVVSINLEHRRQVVEEDTGNQWAQCAIVLPPGWKQRLTAPYNLVTMAVLKQRGYQSMWYHNELCTRNISN